MRNYKYSSTGIILSIKEIIQTMQNESEKYLLFALWPTGFILLIPALLNESNQLFDILSLFWISLSVAVIILGIITSLTLLLLLIGGFLLPKYTYLRLEKILRFIEYLELTRKNKDTIEESLLKIEDINQVVKEINSRKKLIKLFYSKSIKSQYVKFIREFSQFVILILTDLRSDLQIRLNEQQKILKSARSEVSENIRGTSELAQVSELQRVRLDKQIEQFEELQRVLVKV